MTGPNNIFNRIFVFVVGLLITLAGALSVALFFDVHIAQQLVDRARPREWASIPGSPWFLFTVGTIGTLALFLGAWGLAVNMQRHRIRRFTLSSDPELGSVDIDLTEVIEAVAESFRSIPKVIRAQGYANREGGLPTMFVTVDAEPTVSISALQAHAETCQKDLIDAVGEQQMQLCFTIQLAPVERSNTFSTN